MKIYIYITRSITNPVCIYIYEYYEFQWQTRSITNRKHPSFSRLTARCITSVTSLSASIHLSIFIIQGSGFKIASCKICFMFCDISPTELLSQPHLAMITVCNPLFFFVFFLPYFSLPTQHLLQRAIWDHELIQADRDAFGAEQEDPRGPWNIQPFPHNLIWPYYCRYLVTWQHINQ